MACVLLYDIHFHNNNNNTGAGYDSSFLTLNGFSEIQRGHLQRESLNRGACKIAIFTNISLQSRIANFRKWTEPQSCNKNNIHLYNRVFERL